MINNPQIENIMNESAHLDEIDLRHYWQLILRYKRNIIALSLVLTLFSVLVVLALTPVYQATVTILIESEKAKAVSIEDVVGVDTSKREYYQTQFEVIKSYALAEKVVDQLNLVENPLFMPKESGFSFSDLIPIDQEKTEVPAHIKKQIVTNKFLSMLTVTPVRNTQLVNVSIDSTDAEFAAHAANTLAEVYIESHLEAKLAVTQKAASWLGVRLEGLRKKLNFSEVELQNFKEKEHLVDIAGVQTLTAKGLEKLTEQLIDTRRLRSDLGNTYEQIKELQSENTDNLFFIQSISQHPLIQHLKNEESSIERKVAELAKRYGPLHPKMIAAQSDLVKAHSMLERQVSDVVKGIQKQYQVAKENERTLQQQIDNSKAELQQISRKTFEYNKLEREVSANQQLYNLFLARVKETGETAGFEAAHARVVDPAVVPRNSIKPKKKLIVVLSFILSVMLGFMLVVLYDFLDNTIKSPHDVEIKLKAAMLGMLPLIKDIKNDKSKGAYKGFIDDKQSTFSESVRTIRTGIILSSLDKPNKMITITSSVPSEGKSTLAVNLAAAMGQMEKTLLIDADMRRPTLAKTYGIASYAPGLSNLVAGTAELSECLHHQDKENYDVITAGIIPPNPLELLSSPRFEAVLADLAKQYDRIIIDSPPTHAVSDSMVLGKLTDLMIYVVRADSTASPAIINGLKRLHQVGVHVAGIVLNQVDTDRLSSYNSDYYYGGYYDSYGYSAQIEKDSV